MSDLSELYHDLSENFSVAKLLLEHDKIVKFKGLEGIVVDKEGFLTSVNDAVKLGKGLLFESVNFSEINISTHSFEIPIFFINCNFNENLKFTYCNFYYPLFCYGCNFYKSAKFKLSSFFDSLAFVSSKFYKEVSFDRAKFLENRMKYIVRERYGFARSYNNFFNDRNSVDFLGVLFAKTLTFINTNFGCSILFADYNNNPTEFYDETDFSCSVEAKDVLELKTATDQGLDSHEISVDTFHRIGFIGVKFYKEITFENRIFQKKTSFRDATFHIAPKFHNCDLHQDTDFSGSRFKDTTSPGAERAYRTLRLIMEKNRSRREEGMFFALEQKSILNIPIRSYGSKYIDRFREQIDHMMVRLVFGKNSYKYDDFDYRVTQSLKHISNHYGFYVSLTEKIISFLYLLCSNYGQSLKRPLLILIVSIFGVFTPLYKFLLYFSGNDAKSSTDMAIKFSMQQIFRPFEIYSVRMADFMNDVPSIIYFVATVQSLFSLGLLTLFLLAIRGRFRMF